MKIGEIFKYRGKWYQILPRTHEKDCIECSFCANKGSICETCIEAYTTGKDVVFKELEQIGSRFYSNTYSCECIRYASFRPDIVIPPTFEGVHIEFDTVVIEVSPKSRTESDNNMSMIESKIKPFNLEEARKGKPVCTRDGRKARIICFDRKYDKFHKDSNIVALITEGEDEYVRFFNRDGKCEDNRKCDLMMVLKEEVWVNVYKDPKTGYYKTGTGTFESEKVARENNNEEDNYITSIKFPIETE